MLMKARKMFAKKKKLFLGRKKDFETTKTNVYEFYSRDLNQQQSNDKKSMNKLILADAQFSLF